MPDPEESGDAMKRDGEARGREGPGLLAEVWTGTGVELVNGELVEGSNEKNAA